MMSRHRPGFGSFFASCQIKAWPWADTRVVWPSGRGPIGLFSAHADGRRSRQCEQLLRSAIAVAPYCLKTETGHQIERPVRTSVPTVARAYVVGSNDAVIAESKHLRRRQ